jgi:hypothetical protein
MCADCARYHRHPSLQFLTLKQAPSANGEYPVILFAVSIASAYVVTPVRDYPADDPSHPELWGFSNFYSPDPSRSVALMPRHVNPCPAHRLACAF